MPKVIGFLHRNCPPLTHCTDPWNWRVGRRRGLLGFLGDALRPLGAIDPAFAFAQAVDPYTWRYRPTDPMYRAYGWGGHMTVGMPASYTHHIDYVKTPVFGLGNYLGQANVPPNVDPNTAPANVAPNVYSNVSPNRAPSPPPPPAGPWPSTPAERYVPGPSGPIPLVTRITSPAPAFGPAVTAAGPSARAMAMHPSAVTAAPAASRAMGPMRARGAATSASAMGPSVVRGRAVAQYAGTVRQVKPLPPSKRLAPVIMADRLPMAGLRGGMCMVGGIRRPLHRCQRPSLPMQMLGAILAVL